MQVFNESEFRRHVRKGFGGLLSQTGDECFLVLVITRFDEEFRKRKLIGHEVIGADPIFVVCVVNVEPIMRVGEIGNGDLVVTVQIYSFR
jgi:hypothetical protein